MARYDSEGYNSRGRRQILGYSRAVQGGADEARARANQRIAEGWNPSLRFARQRAQRVAEAQAAGTFNATREAYNDAGEAAGVEMDAQGNIARKPQASVMAKPYQYLPPRPARSTPLNYQRPADQRVNDIVGMASPGGLLDMARTARRRGTFVMP